MAPPDTVFAPPVISEAAESSGPASEARTAILPKGSALPPTAVQPASASPRPPAAPRGDVASADTAKAARPGAGAGAAPQPVPPPPAAPAADGGGGVNYVPTQAVSPEMVASLRRTASKPGGGAPGPVP
ncbi:hypothetical protein E1265_26640, partial [Streptomyces sp. 8K308]